MIDELGDLEAESAQWRTKAARLEAVRAAVREAYRKADPTQNFRAEGERWGCLIGAAGDKSVVDRAALLKMIGAKKFAAVANIPVEKLKAAYGATIYGAVVSMAPIGPRPLAIVPRNGSG